MSEHIERWLLLSSNGKAGPESIEKYQERRGYEGANRALTELSPEAVTAMVEKVRLRGRGGGGFPVTRKWRLARDNAKGTTYVVANAYDADPAAPIARALIEHTPHALLEGLIITAYAVGAQEAFIYIRGENAEAVRCLRLAIAEAEEQRLLGLDAFGGAWPLTVRIVRGWGGFSGGEETAVLEAIEGRRAMPRQKPPYPVEVGLWGCPTVVQSAETLANLPPILLGGVADQIAQELDSGFGMKIIGLCGDVAKPGLVEVPFGATLREIIFGLGDGVPQGRAVKGVQIGGPTGAVLPASYLDTPLGYSSLAGADAFLGSGSMHVIADDGCAVHYALDQISYLARESCGKCVPCRLGLQRLVGLLEGVVSNIGRQSDVLLMQELAEVVQNSSLCGFGAKAPTVLLSTILHFRQDYGDHIEAGRCAPGHCQPLRTRRLERKTAI
ncbi:MAG: complex I 51 kDa subunit family protein [Chloroflexota bacterium]